MTRVKQHGALDLQPMKVFALFWCMLFLDVDRSIERYVCSTLPVKFGQSNLSSRHDYHYKNHMGTLWIMQSVEPYFVVNPFLRKPLKL